MSSGYEGTGSSGEGAPIPRSSFGEAIVSILDSRPAYSVLHKAYDIGLVCATLSIYRHDEILLSWIGAQKINFEFSDAKTHSNKIRELNSIILSSYNVKSYKMRLIVSNYILQEIFLGKFEFFPGVFSEADKNMFSKDELPYLFAACEVSLASIISIDDQLFTKALSGNYSYNKKDYNNTHIKLSSVHRWVESGHDLDAISLADLVYCKRKISPRVKKLMGGRRLF